MKILGIETSCDETAVSIVEDGRHVLSSVIFTQVEEHGLYGGVVPEIASRRHVEQISGVYAEAMAEAGLSLSQLDAVAVTYAPGLIGALLVGLNFAKGIALGGGLPLVPVHHIRGHIAANYLAFAELAPPFLALVVSGGHSHMIEVRDYTDFRVVGRTRDDAAGEAFDKVARAMGLSYPGGQSIDREARSGNSNAYSLPEPKVEGSPYDFSFSGLKTSVLNQLHNTTQKGETISVQDMSASFEKTVSNILVARTMAAAKTLNYDKIVVAGGVSANTGLRAAFEIACREESKELFVPPLSLCGDNAMMIASQGYYELLEGHIGKSSLPAMANLSIEEIRLT